MQSDYRDISDELSSIKRLISEEISGKYIPLLEIIKFQLSEMRDTIHSVHNIIYEDKQGELSKLKEKVNILSKRYDSMVDVIENVSNNGDLNG